MVNLKTIVECAFALEMTKQSKEKSRDSSIGKMYALEPNPVRLLRPGNYVNCVLLYMATGKHGDSSETIGRNYVNCV